MTVADPNDFRRSVDALYRSESRRVLATLIRLLGDFDAAEEALHDAFVTAVERWPAEGLPANPRAWLVSVGRFKALDRSRQRLRFDRAVATGAITSARDVPAPDSDDEALHDDRLRLIFTCCHPALSLDAQIALTLRTVCGLTTEEIARAFLTPAPTLAQRIVRAKAKIRDAGIPYQVPDRTELPERLDAVLRVIYLVFSEGYAPSLGDTVVREDLSREAIRLARLLVELLPEPEAIGLLALLLLHDSRRDARTDGDGDIVLLEAQDRTLWHRPQIAEGVALVERALATRPVGSYALQAAIAGVHAESSDAASTDWPQIVMLYDLLLEAEPSPVVALNRAVAVAMRDGPEAGLQLIDTLLADGLLQSYQLAHAARADLLRRAGRTADARIAYHRALELTTQPAERRLLERRMAALAR
ncbi:MAG: RNA polymerase sigma factor [Gemmatimonadaceae bacterium]